MNQKRQPKGTRDGGQFAPDVNAESTVILLDAPSTCVVCGDPDHLGLDCPLCASLLDPNKKPAIDAGNVCLKCGRSSGWVNRIPSTESTEDGLVTIEGYVCSECSNCQEGLVAAWCPECDEFTLGYEDTQECGQCGGVPDASIPVPEGDEPERSICTQCTGETNFDFEAFADKLRVERDGHEGPFQVGSVLEYDVEVVPWVPGMHEENVAVQVWMEEWGDADNNCAGWEPRAIAQIARERGITNVTNRDLQDILDDPDIDKIAFRSDTSITTLIKQINDCNSEDVKS